MKKERKIAHFSVNGQNSRKSNKTKRFKIIWKSGSLLYDLRMCSKNVYQFINKMCIEFQKNEDAILPPSVWSSFYILKISKSSLMRHYHSTFFYYSYLNMESTFLCFRYFRRIQRWIQFHANFLTYLQFQTRPSSSYTLPLSTFI